MRLKFNLAKIIKRNPKTSRLVVIVAFAVIGAAVIAFSRAATSSVAIQPEDGQLLSCLSEKTDDSTASGNGYVQFGCPASNGDLVIISPESELSSVKQAVKSGEKKQYWDYVKSKGYISDPRTSHIPNWSGNQSYTIRCGSQDITYTFDPITYISTDHADGCSSDAQGRHMHNSGLNAYTTALRWRFDDDQANGSHAVNLINSWVDNFQAVSTQSGPNDIRDNQVRLNSGWFIASFTKALEIIWDHPSFTQQRKQQTADWLWEVFLDEDPVMHENNSEVLGQQHAGWNGRTGFLQARLNIGLVMKAAGHQNADQVISQVIADFESVIPEILYYGKQPWHEALGQPWPKQPYRKLGNSYAGWNTPNNLKDYWFFTTNSSTPPPYFVGQTQETGRDVAHNQLGTGSLTESLRAIRLNGYGDWFKQSKIGDVLLGLGEQHADYYNETLDEFWSGGYSSLDNFKNNVWEPDEWDQFKFKVPFCVCGEGADHGWEFLRTELKRNGYSTPELDRMVTRLRGVSPRSSNKAAGYAPLRTANNQAWEPLFALDYQ